ncbi:hypothetical protein B0J17DRAFT_631909 [Rhizoctonia solani]|nr:hypothetical protein B0J17DRAFT_631909 [Rhizoctonia solani]
MVLTFTSPSLKFNTRGVLLFMYKPALIKVGMKSIQLIHTLGASDTAYVYGKSVPMISSTRTYPRRDDYSPREAEVLGAFGGALESITTFLSPTGGSVTLSIGRAVKARRYYRVVIQSQYTIYRTLLRSDMKRSRACGVGAAMAPEQRVTPSNWNDYEG